MTNGPSSSGSGVVTGRDAYLSGQVVVARDLNVYSAQIVPPPERTRIFQLPPDIGHFTNRSSALAEIGQLLERREDGNGTAVVISAIAGKPGVGKTALATHIAHRVQQHFPDGQLYVNLRGAEDDQRQDPGTVLGDVLLELGVARAAIPDGLEQRAARYRAQLADHQYLVVLDNAADEAQVRPLLPGSLGCAVLITSRAELTGLSGYRLALGELDLDQGVELLAKLAGRDRVEAEPDAARQIVRLCGYLPLAVRIAGGKLAARRHWTLATLARKLAGDHNLMAELKLRDLEVRASFELSYRDLEPEERRAFRLLGRLKTPDFTAWVAAALLGRDLDEAEELLDRLVEAQVLEGPKEPQAGEVRYRFHDLLRVFARDLPVEERPASGVDAALERALDAHVFLAEYAASRLEPGASYQVDPRSWLATTAQSVTDRIASDPSAWFAAERVNLMSALEQAYEHGVNDVVWRLARSLNYFFKLRSHWSDWMQTQTLARRAARRLGDGSARANSLRSLGDVATQRQNFRAAVRRFTCAIDLFRSLDDERGEAWAHVGLGNAYLDKGSYDQALAEFELSLSRFRSIGDRRGAAWALVGLGIFHRVRGRFDDAEASCQNGLDEFGPLRDRRGQAYCLVNLGILHRQRGKFEDALSWFDRARPIFRELGDHHGETFVLLNIGHMYREQEQFEEAIAALETCRATFHEFGERGGEAWALLNLAMVWTAQGRHDEAVARFHWCHALFHELGDARGRAWTTLGLGEAYRQRGDPDQALACLDDALQALEQLGERLAVAKALHGKGLALEDAGQRDDAVAAVGEALGIFRDLGASEVPKVEHWLRDRGR